MPTTTLSISAPMASPSSLSPGASGLHDVVAPRAASATFGSNGSGFNASHASQNGAASSSRPRSWALNSLPPDVWRRLEPMAQRTLLFQGQVLHEAGSTVERVYLPNSGLVSLILPGPNNEQIEVAMSGREGAVGALELLSNCVATETAVVQVPGTAMWLPASAVREEWKRNGAFQDWTLRFLSSLMAQKAQCALCNRLHSVEERLCRWLLGLRERVESDEIEITHGSIARMLGARRSGVTVALGTLASQGLLDTGRGRICLLDVDGLKATSCACHTTLSQSFLSLRGSINA